MRLGQLHGKGWVDGHGASATCKDTGDSKILLKKKSRTLCLFLGTKWKWHHEVEVVDVVKRVQEVLNKQNYRNEKPVRMLIFLAPACFIYIYTYTREASSVR